METTLFKNAEDDIEPRIFCSTRKFRNCLNRHELRGQEYTQTYAHKLKTKSIQTERGT